jgi:hypothetical protein
MQKPGDWFCPGCSGLVFASKDRKYLRLKHTVLYTLSIAKIDNNLIRIRLRQMRRIQTERESAFKQRESAADEQY